MQHWRSMCAAALAVVAFMAPRMGDAAEQIPVGNLAALTGPTSPVASVYAQGIIDAFAYINQNSGISGRQVKLDTQDYGYDAPKAIKIYKDWQSTLKPVAIQGWGTADTEALIDLVTKDKVVFMSGSSSGHLTDPTGRSPWTEMPAPYNFFYGPSYSDGCRALVKWAATHWKKTGGIGRSTFLGDLNRPKFTFMGDNHPFPNSPKAACTEYARDLGFEILPPIRYSLTPADFTAQCQTLKQTGSHYAFLANTAESNVALLKACAQVGVDTQFLTNIYGWDEASARIAGDAGNGLVWVVSAALWGDDVPGMKTVEAISKQSDPDGTKRRSVHYIRGVCSAYFMRDAIAAAEAQGTVDGTNIKKGFEAMRDHVPAGMEGVCLPSTWTPVDHRGTTTVMLYQNVSNYGNIVADKIFTTTVPLRPDWLGW